MAATCSDLLNLICTSSAGLVGGKYDKFRQFIVILMNINLGKMA